MKGSVHKKGRFYVISMYWEGERWWFDKDKDTGHKFWNRDHAKQVLSEMHGEIKRGEFNPRNWKPEAPIGIGVYFDEWLSLKSASKKTIRDYRGYFQNWIIPHIGETKDIRRIRANDIIRLINAINDRTDGKVSKHTYNIISCLRTMLRDAARNEDISKVPPFPILSYNPPEIEALSIEQQEILIDTITERDRPIFIIGMELGLRTQELRALKKDCVKDGYIQIKRTFRENELHETTKTGKMRELPITDTVRQTLNTASSMPRFNPFVFTRADGKPYTNKNLNKIWSEACLCTGINIKLQNAFRHSLGCQLLDLGEDMDMVRDILGHSDMRMTRRYAKRDLETKRKAFERRSGTVVKLRKKSIE